MARLDLQEILLRRWRSQSLAHFYILETGHFPSAKEALKQKVTLTMETLLKEELQKKNLASPQKVWEHPDFLYVSPKEDKKEYSVEDFSESDFFNFIEWRPYQLSWRFVCIEDAYKIGQNLCNKLLKTLEEPPANTTILFLNPYGKPFMPTIQSRAITLRYCSPRLEEESPLGPNFQFSGIENGELKELFSSFLKDKKGPAELLETLKASERSFQNEAYTLILDLERSCLSNFEHKAKVLSALEWFQNSQTYNNPSSERFFLLLKALESL